MIEDPEPTAGEDRAFQVRANVTRAIIVVWFLLMSLGIAWPTLVQLFHHL